MPNPPNQKPVPDEQLISDLQELADELGSAPTGRELSNRDDYYSPSLYRNRFGTWNEALAEAGLEVNCRRDIDKSVVIGEIKKVAEEIGETPNYHQIDDHASIASGTVLNHFETWNTALKAAGLDVNHRSPTLIEVECTVCGKVMNRQRQDVEGPDRYFCGYECMGEWRREHLRGENHPSYNRIEVECANCGEDVSVQPSRYEWLDNHFCDEDCYREYGSAARVCANCGEEFRRAKSAVKGKDRVFCEIECYREWLREGDRHQQGGGWCGSLYEAVRSGLSNESWSTIRKDERADSCEMCGIFAPELHVHHIIPVMAGGTNDSWNLMTLCRGCHYDVEGRTREFVEHVLRPEYYGTHGESVENGTDSLQSRLSFFKE